MKPIRTLLIIASLVFAAALPAQAQLKLGTVDMEEVFKGYYKTKDAEKEINKAREAAKKDLDGRMESLKTMMDAINKLNEEMNNKALSESARATKGNERDTKIAEARNLEREVNEFRVQREGQLRDQMARMRKNIVDEIMVVVNEKVKAANYDLVVDRSGLSANGVPVILFARDTADFSAEVVTELNKSQPKS